jgi:hypothetical protein
MILSIKCTPRLSGRCMFNVQDIPEIVDNNQQVNNKYI